MNLRRICRAWAMSTLAVLVNSGGEPQLAFQVLCDGVPLRAVVLEDPTTDTLNVRFLAPRPGGRLTMRVYNCGLEKGAFVELNRAILNPWECWLQCRNAIVNKANVLLHGESMTVVRDEGAGGRSFLVQTLRDAQGCAVRADDVVIRGLQRTKWRLGVWAEYNAQHLLNSTWRLMDSDHNVVPLRVVTPTEQAMWAATRSDSVDWLKERVERELGVPRAEQRLCGADGSSLERMSDILNQQSSAFPTLFVWGQRQGDRLWFFVQRPSHAKRFVVTSSSRTVHQVRSEVGGSQLDALFLHGEELPGTRTLSECNLSCLDTLEIREHGSLRVTLAVEVYAPTPCVRLVVDEGQDYITDWWLRFERRVAYTPTDSLMVEALPVGTNEHRAASSLTDADALMVELHRVPGVGPSERRVFSTLRDPVVVEVSVDPEDTVAELCRRAVIKATPDSQLRRGLLLFHQWKLSFGTEQLRDARSVAECGITASSRGLRVRGSLRRTNCCCYCTANQIMIRFTIRGNVFLRHPFLPTDTVELLKFVAEDVRKHSESRSPRNPPSRRVQRLPPSVEYAPQKILFEGRELQDEQCTLADCGIGDSSIIDVVDPVINTDDNMERMQALRLDEDEDTADAVAAQPAAATSQPAAGSIAFGSVVPTPRTLPCFFTVHLKRGCPQLQFEVYVDEEAAPISDLKEGRLFQQLIKRLKTKEM